MCPVRCVTYVSSRSLPVRKQTASQFCLACSGRNSLHNHCTEALRTLPNTKFSHNESARFAEDSDETNGLVEKSGIFRTAPNGELQPVWRLTPLARWLSETAQINNYLAIWKTDAKSS